LQSESVEADKAEPELESGKPIISDEKKIVKTLDDYELVEPNNVEASEEPIGENEKNAKWVFDDLKIHDDVDLQNSLDSAETPDGYSEVKDPFSSKTIVSDCRNEKDNLGKS
jgi:hypothetical protein